MTREQTVAAGEALAVAGRQYAAQRERTEARRVAIRAAIVAALEAGVSESEAARLAGVDRMTVRRWTGKR